MPGKAERNEQWTGGGRTARRRMITEDEESERMGCPVSGEDHENTDPVGAWPRDIQ